MADYAEMIMKGVEILVDAKLKNLNFDTTIICTIIDNSSASLGTYQVSDGSIKFTAYSSDTTYKVNDQVYVSIPNNDYTEQKIITGKKTNLNNNIPYNYKSPFASFIKATSNLTSATQELSLVANWQKQLDGSYIQNKEDSIIIMDIFDNLPKTEIPYTKIGLKANFKSLLPNNVIKGNYGLALTINNGQGWLDPVALDCEDMFGNPYQFFTYINQEIVFEIPKTVSKIAGLKLIFFQEGNFTPYQNSNNEEDIFGDLRDNSFNGVVPNLFVSGIELYLGYDVADLSGDKYYINIENDEQLSYNYIEGQANTRRILGEWIHVDENTGESIIINPNIQINNLIQDEKLFKGLYWPKEYDIFGKVTKYQGIKWYHKVHGANSPDNYAGTGWEILLPSTLNITTNPLAATITLNNNTLEDMFKSIIFDDLIFDETIDLTETLERTEIFENEENTDEILINYIKSCKPITSNILTFSNIDFDVNGISNKQTQLNLVPRDGYNGNYYFYQFSTIENKDWAKESRYLDIYYEGTQLNYDNKYCVEWIVPYSNTMFNIATYKIMDIAIQNIASSDYKDIIKIIDLDKNKLPFEGIGSIAYKKIIIDNTKNHNKAENFSFSLQYQIKEIYSAQDINNNIDCKVYRLYDNIPYTTSYRFNFGWNSTSGTEVYLDCEVKKYKAITNEYEIINPPVILMNYNTEQIFQIKPQFRLNSSNEIIKFIDFEYSWDGYDKGNKPKGIKEVNLNEGVIEIIVASSVIEDDYAVLKIVASYQEVQNLTCYISFAYADNINDTYAEVPDGPFEIIYNSASGLPFDKSSYNTSYNIDNLSELNWDIYKQGSSLPISDEEKIYYPHIKNNKLIPTTLFTENLDKVSVRAIAQNKIAWSQPLLILKNKFPNSMINEWNGELIVDNEKNTIISAMMAAGTKNVNNQFSGVLMGKIQGVSEENSLEQHGIYGYHEGDQSFAFKEDGTAFLGKSGKGRIEFNGNEGTIKSSLFDEGQGIEIDLDNNTFTSRANENYTNSIELLKEYLRLIAWIELGKNIEFKFEIYKSLYNTCVGTIPENLNDETLRILRESAKYQFLLKLGNQDIERLKDYYTNLEPKETQENSYIKEQQEQSEKLLFRKDIDRYGLELQIKLSGEFDYSNPQAFTIGTANDPNFQVDWLGNTTIKGDFNIVTEDNEVIFGVNKNKITFNLIDSKLQEQEDKLNNLQAQQNEYDNTKIKTRKEFTFDDNGLRIFSPNNLETLITEDGMQVIRSTDPVLIANNEGVKAEDLQATTYLIIGDNSRFQDYKIQDNTVYAKGVQTDDRTKKRTGCFWIGG